MHVALTALLNRMDSPALADSNVIKWGAPVPSFGDLSSSFVATIGLNPSNREFVDDSGKNCWTMTEDFIRSVHSDSALGLMRCATFAVDRTVLCMYFSHNPYDRWFKKLDQIVAAPRSLSTPTSIPRAILISSPMPRRSNGWNCQTRTGCLNATADALGLLLRDSPVRVLILNGKTVVEQFQYIAGVLVERRCLLGLCLANPVAASRVRVHRRRSIDWRTFG